MNGKQDKTTIAVMAFLVLTALTFFTMCILFCIVLIKGASTGGWEGIPMIEAQTALFLAFLALAFGIAVGTPYFISRGKIKRIIDKYVKHEYKLELSNLAEETAKLDSHLSRMTAFFLLEQNYCYWAIGWAFRALKRYGELSKIYADIYREFNTFIIEEIIIKALQKAKEDEAERRFSKPLEPFRIKLRAVKDYVDFLYEINESQDNKEMGKIFRHTHGDDINNINEGMKPIIVALYFDGEVKDFQRDFDEEIFKISRFKDEMPELKRFYYTKILESIILEDKRFETLACYKDAQYKKYKSTNNF
ncbi:MAG: hypothetical protein ACTTHU_02175 [Treponema sp.]